MTEPYRRSVIAGGLTLIGGAISVVGPGKGADADSNGGDVDVGGASDDEQTDEAGDEIGRDETDTAPPALELSVSVPESVSGPEGRAEFLITVLNCGGKTRSTPISLEVGRVQDELEAPSLAPGESVDTYASYAGRCLESGVLEWSVAVGTACERGTLSVT
ncbi:hypothetical protein [Natronococcus sp.]|uniref:hypothetical protein n=1 Tax=Natronococcus sp. TaxID=35747 RepID=UPI0025DC284D|nr:hypothetical protein [Natronococcus sp.]